MANSISPKLIGQTEKTMNAILQRIIGDRVTEPEWVSLVVLAGAGEFTSSDATGMVAGALKVQPPEGERVLGSLTRRGLIGATTAGKQGLTDDGRALVSEVRVRTDDVIQRLWGDLPAEELEVAANVLSAVLARAERELAAL